MEPTLVVVGLDFRTAPVAVRERFWISESRRHEALADLGRGEGIEEILILTTCNRTEFMVWASDATLAANSVLRFLSAQCGLKLCEWKHFYRLLDEAALVHIFRVTASLESMVIGEPQITGQVKAAWQQAQEVGTSGRFLDAILQKALLVSKRVRNETAIGNAALSIPYAAVETARQRFGSLAGRKVVLLGAGKMSELSAHYLLNRGTGPLYVISRTLAHAQELAAKVEATAIAFEDRRQHLIDADIVISATSSPDTILTREEAEGMVRERKNEPWCLIDIAVPRDIDPTVRNVPGIALYDIDDLEQVLKRNPADRQAAATQAHKIVETEAKEFRRGLLAERVVPTIVALRERLESVCRQEMRAFCQECGPFSKQQEELLAAVVSRVTQRIAGSLARELKEVPEKLEQEQMTAAVQRLFHLESRDRETARV